MPGEASRTSPLTGPLHPAPWVVMALVALILPGCGDATTDATYKGKPLFRINGELAGTLPMSPLAHPRVGVAWMTVASGQPAAGQSAEITLGDFPAKFTLDFVDEPPAAAFGSFLGLVDMPGVAIGFLLAFDDVDNDRRFIPGPTPDLLLAAPDRAFGLVPNALVYYVKEGEAVIAASAPGELTPEEITALRSPERALLAGKYRIIASCDESDLSASVLQLSMFEPASRAPNNLMAQLFCEVPAESMTEDEHVFADDCFSGHVEGEDLVRLVGTLAGEVVAFQRSAPDYGSFGLASLSATDGDAGTYRIIYKGPEDAVSFGEGDVSTGQATLWVNDQTTETILGSAASPLCADARMFRKDYVDAADEDIAEVAGLTLTNLRTGPSCELPLAGNLKFCLVLDR